MSNDLSRRRFLGTALPRPPSPAGPRCCAEVCTTLRHLPMARRVLARRSIVSWTCAYISLCRHGSFGHRDSRVASLCNTGVTEEGLVRRI